MGAFMVPNTPIPENTPIEVFAVPVEVVERASGLTFFQKIPRTFSLPLCERTQVKTVF
jgi:endonuclease G